MDAHRINGCLETQISNLDFFGLDVVQSTIADSKADLFISPHLQHCIVSCNYTYHIKPETATS